MGLPMGDPMLGDAGVWHMSPRRDATPGLQALAQCQIGIEDVEESVSGVAAWRHIPTPQPLGVHDHHDPTSQPRPARHEMTGEPELTAVYQRAGEVHVECRGIGATQAFEVTSAAEGAAQVSAEEPEWRKGIHFAPSGLDDMARLGVSVHDDAVLG